ncbi:MAG: tetratricopeptide repeat protein [Rhodoferax sp.]|nr:tetratricopeptide repeat protein [Rhodoferax sp.]
MSKQSRPRKPVPARPQARLTHAQSIELARSLVMRSEFATAASLLKTLLAEQPDDTTVLHLQAVMLNMQGQHAQALPLIERALKREPNHAGRWNDYGIVLGRLQRQDEAIAAYQRCISVAGETSGAASAYNNLGRLYRETDPAQAELAFRRATELAPGFAQAWYNLSQLLPEMGRIAEGMDAWAQATVLAPQNAPAEHHARALVHLGRTSEAIALYQAQLERDPDNPLVRHHLAALLKPDTPTRASDAYVETVFDGFAATFDGKLAQLNYRAPTLIREALAGIYPAAEARAWRSPMPVAALACVGRWCCPGRSNWWVLTCLAACWRRQRRVPSTMNCIRPNWCITWATIRRRLTWWFAPTRCATLPA